MDKDRVIGSAKQVKGAVKQAVGKAVGDAKLELHGKADKIEGKVQNAVGGIKDTLKGNKRRGRLNTGSAVKAVTLIPYSTEGGCL